MTAQELSAAIAAKACPVCGKAFSTQADTLAHVAAEHPILSHDVRGPVVIERVLMPPYPRERSPRIRSRVLYHGDEIEGAGWAAEWFVRGVEWAEANLGVTT